MAQFDIEAAIKNAVRRTFNGYGWVGYLDTDHLEEILKVIKIELAIRKN